MEIEPLADQMPNHKKVTVKNTVELDGGLKEYRVTYLMSVRYTSINKVEDDNGRYTSNFVLSCRT